MLSAFLYLLNGRRKTQVKVKSDSMSTLTTGEILDPKKKCFFSFINLFKVSLTLRNRIYCLLLLKNNESLYECESSLLTSHISHSCKTCVDCFQCAIFSDISLRACRRYAVEHNFSPHLKTSWKPAYHGWQRCTDLFTFRIHLWSFPICCKLLFYCPLV